MAFLFHRIKFFVLLAGLTVATWYSIRFLPIQYQFIGEYAYRLLGILCLGWFLFLISRTYLEYRRYTYGFTKEAFIVTYGYLIRNEIAAIYHQIHSVNIKRTYTERVFGVSQLIILMAGGDRESHHNQIILPGLGHKRAKLIQKELLIRAREHTSSHGV